MKPQKTLNSQSNPKKEKNKARSITLTDFKLYYKVTIIKTAWYWQKNRHRDQWNRIKSLEPTGILENLWAKLCIHGQIYVYGQNLIFNKTAKNIQWRKESLIKKWCWKIGKPIGKLETRLQFVPYTKIKHKIYKKPNYMACNNKLQKSKHRY